LDALVRPSIPILYFGDDRRYFTSLRKIITVGLNPSCKEFPADDRFQRFPRARNATPDAPALADHLHALRDYFREKPYDAWFRPSFEPILNGLGASYYDGASNTALHTDLFSPLATDPTWSRLGDRRRQLETDGVSLWHRLVVRLTPDVIIISVARAYLDKIGFLRLNEWRTIHTVDRENPFSVEARRVRIGEEKTALLVFGRAANIPFGTVSSHDKQRIGAAIAKVLDE
jgi:hypothetical protein